jgi:hypothetical protein
VKATTNPEVICSSTDYPILGLIVSTDYMIWRWITRAMAIGKAAEALANVHTVYMQVSRPALLPPAF